MNEEKSVSLKDIAAVIAALNEEKGIGATLRSLERFCRILFA